MHWPGVLVHWLEMIEPGLAGDVSVVARAWACWVRVSSSEPISEFLDTTYAATAASTTAITTAVVAAITRRPRNVIVL